LHTNLLFGEKRWIRIAIYFDGLGCLGCWFGGAKLI
jgi:hypothetical protein